MSKKKGGANHQTNNELDWFAFETRIMKLIQGLVEPINKRSLDAKEASDAQTKMNDILKRKVEELEFITHKSQKKSVIFEEINNKLTKLEVNQRGIEQQLDEEVSALSGKLEFTKGQIRSNREETGAVEKKIDETRNEISLIHESLLRIKEEIISQVSGIDEDLHNQLANIRINLNSMNE